MSQKLRDLIRSVRACKTAAEERAIITKESALIRTAFKDETHAEYRHRNVAKLLYFSILGYPTHFGQMECIKLLASGRFNEKRIGYLALMLLLDEKQEVLTLVTNSLQMDLNHPNQFVAGLALTALGTIGSAEMARDLANDVDKHLKGANPYLRKKAALCTIRLLKRVPDLLDTFLPHIVVLLTDKNHNVLLCGVTLVTAVVQLQPSYVERFGRLVPALIKILRKLLLAGTAPEYDIGGVTDPFLQSKILYLLRILGANNASAAEAMQAVLAQVATNTEASRNSGSAVLYEAVNVIMAISANTAASSASAADVVVTGADAGDKQDAAGLKVLALNILGRFLSSKDANHRYVALETLTRVINHDVAAVQRHRAVIVECLRDPDVSIRRRALDLVYALVNADNVRPLTKELLNYVSVADAETKADLCVKIAAVADKYAPSRRWHIDTLISLLAACGDTAKRPVISMALFLISHTPSEHAALTHKLFAMAQTALSGAATAGTAEHSQQLLQVAIWCIGEYGQLLLTAPPSPPAEDSVGPVGEVRTEIEIVRCLDKALHAFGAVVDTKAMVLTALLKLVVKLSPTAPPAGSGSEKAAPGSAEAALNRARKIIASYEGSQDIELQARAVEFSAIADPYGRLNRPVHAAAAASTSSGGDSLLGLEVLSSNGGAGAAASGSSNPAAPIVATHRAELLAPIPLLEENVLRVRAAPSGIMANAAEAALGTTDEVMAVQERTRPKGSGAGGEAGATTGGGAADLLGDLNDLLGGVATTTAAAAPTAAGAGSATGAAAAGKKKAGASALDLDDLFSSVAASSAGPSASGAASVAAPAPAPVDLFSAPAPLPAPAPAPAAAAPARAVAKTGMAALDDLFGSTLSGMTGGALGSPAPAPAPKSLSAMAAATTAPASSGGVGGLGNLDALFGGASISSTTPAPAPAPPAVAASPLDLFGASAPAPAPAPAAAAAAMDSGDDFEGFAEAPPSGPPSFTAYDGPHVTAVFTLEKPAADAPSHAAGATDIHAVFKPKAGNALSGFVCQVAPPKFVKLTLLPASGTSLGPAASNTVTQVIRVENTQHGTKALILKLRLVYTTASGEQVTEVHDVKNFPAGY